MFGTKWIIVWVVWPCLTYLLRTTIFSSEVEGRGTVRRFSQRTKKTSKFLGHGDFPAMRCWQQLNSHQLQLSMEKTYDICQIVWETVTKVQVNAYFHWWLCGQWMVYVQWKHETHMGGSICIIFMADPPRFMVYMENPWKSYGKSQSKMDDEQGHPMT